MEEEIASIKRGDPKAFTDAFEQFHQKTFSFFMTRTSRDRELSKELAQLTFIKLWRSRATLSPQYPLEAQLFVMAKSILVDHLRSAASRQTMVSVSGLTDTIADSLEPTLQESSFETNHYLDALFSTLPPARKRVIRLKYVEGYSNREIAESLSISVKTVEDHVSKGLKELRTHPGLTLALINALCVVWFNVT